MSTKILPVLSFEDHCDISQRQIYLEKVRSDYTTSRRAARDLRRGIEYQEKKTQDNRTYNLEKSGGKKTRKQHKGSKFISRIRALEKTHCRRVAACNEWECIFNESL
jgi:hypothetical protein